MSNVQRLTGDRADAAERFATARIVDGAELEIPPGHGAFDHSYELDGSITLLVRVRVSAEQIDAQLEVDAQAGGGR